MTCYACHGDIDGAPILVPRLPRGAMRFCAKPACVKSAYRRALVVWRRRPPKASA